MSIFRFEVIEAVGDRESCDVHWLMASSIEEAWEKIIARMPEFYSHANLVDEWHQTYSTGDLEYSPVNVKEVTREELIKELLERSDANGWPVAKRQLV